MRQPQPDGVLVRDIVIVGAGFAGLYMLHKSRGLGLDAVVFERGSGVGGTWYWNRYPGARCDAPSLDYCYSFSPELEQEWTWTERYAAQPEILAYLEHVADRFDLRSDIRFDTTVTAAEWLPDEERWRIRTDRGEEVTARYCVMATGCLSAPRLPDIDGIGDFRGEVLHTGLWPKEPVDFAGKRVGIIGTGSSGIQLTPVAAQTAAEVIVFQRTPVYTIPARNHPLSPDEVATVKASYRQRRELSRMSPSGLPVAVAERSALEVPDDERTAIYEQGWVDGVPILFHFNDLLVDRAANDTAAEFIRRKVREIVRDPDRASILSAHNYPIGTKRLTLDTDYYETFNRDNVSLVDLGRTPIVAVNKTGVQVQGKHYDLDMVVLATGFDAMTGALDRIDVIGEDGIRLRECWSAGPRTYLGIAVAGFPNLFLITGPGSPSVLTNMPLSIEQHVEWLAGLFTYLRENKLAAARATTAAQDKWVDMVNHAAALTLFPTAASWYMGANVPGKPRVFMPFVGGLGTYRQICDDVAADGYEGFEFESPPVHLAEDQASYHGPLAP